MAIRHINADHPLWVLKEAVVITVYVPHTQTVLFVLFFIEEKLSVQGFVFFEKNVEA